MRVEQLILHMFIRNDALLIICYWASGNSSFYFNLIDCDNIFLLSLQYYYVSNINKTQVDTKQDEAFGREIAFFLKIRISQDLTA